MRSKTSITFQIISLLASAQAPEIDWSHVYGGTQNEGANSIVLCNDGGYVVAGYTSSNDGNVSGNQGNMDVWIVKIGSQGDLVWQNCLGGSYVDIAYDVIQVADGGYVLAGVTESDDGDVSSNNGVYNAWVVKLDEMGVLEWEEAVGGTNHESANAIVQRADGGFIVAGGSFSSTLPGHIAPGWDAWIFELDESGNLQQQTCYGTSDSEWFNDIALTADGGYICIGPGPGVNGAWTDILLMKFGAAGNIEWQETYGGTQADDGFAIQQTNDGGYIFVGETKSNDGDVTGGHGGEDAWMVKADEFGNIQWQRALGGSLTDRALAIKPTSIGSYLTAGFTASTDGDVNGNLGAGDLWLIEVDEDGALLWQKCFGGSGGDAAYDMEFTNDGGIIMCGESNSTDGDVLGSNGGSDAWIIKLEDSALLINDTSQIHMIVSPNPAVGHVVIQSDEHVSEAVIRISNALGREVLHDQVTGTRHQLDLSDQAKGIYLVTLQTDQGISTQRLVLE